MRGILALGVLLLGLVGPVNAFCHVGRWSVHWDSEALAQMETDGAPCRINVSWTGNTSEIHSLRVLAVPRSGSASVQGHGVLYRPRGGFKGEDSFAFTLYGRKAGAPQHALIRVDVTVR